MEWAMFSCPEPILRGACAFKYPGRWLNINDITMKRIRMLFMFS
jgi:hypothetical protein